MTRPKCIITGCELACLHWHQHGDLWELGDSYIFNAVGEPSYDTELLPEKVLFIRGLSHNNYFERRNVYVVSKSEATLSRAAEAYIQRTPR